MENESRKVIKLQVVTKLTNTSGEFNNFSFFKNSGYLKDFENDMSIFKGVLHWLASKKRLQ